MSRPLSLTARLTLLFALVAAVVLAALGWAIAAAIDRHFVAMDMDELQGKIMLIRNLLEDADGEHPGPIPEHRLRNAFVGHDNLAMTIATIDGDSLFATSGLRFPRDRIREAATAGVPVTFEWYEGGRHFRGRASVVRAADSPVRSRVAAVAIDIGDHARFIGRFNTALFVYVVVAAVLSALLGRWAVRRGLAPLRLMKAHAAAVTAQRLDRRVPATMIPRELTGLAEELNRMLARLDDAFGRLSDFSSDLAHELRTPISNLMTQTEVALSRPRDATFYRDILTSNLEEYERLARMIADMLFLAEAEHGLILPSRAIVVLEHEFRDLFDFYDALAEQRDIRFRLSGGAQLVGDRLMLRRALSNLLSNALRHARGGSAIRVTIEREAAEVVVTIENAGDTIAAADLPRLFERFYRVGRRTAGGREGSGLGLAITRAIVNAHGGTVSAESGGGHTRFVTRFPRSRPSANRTM